jgi:hypothetical protein
LFQEEEGSKDMDDLKTETGTDDIFAALKTAKKTLGSKKSAMKNIHKQEEMRKKARHERLAKMQSGDSGVLLI